MLLFAYGTLRHDGDNYYRLGRSEFLGKVSTAPGYEILLFSGQFALIPWGQGSVQGELYRVPDKIIEELDLFEKPFRRERLTLENGTEAQYYAAPDWMAQKIQEGLADYIEDETNGSPERRAWLIGRGAPPARTRGCVMDQKTQAEVIATLKKMGREDLVRHIEAKKTEVNSTFEEFNDLTNEADSLLAKLRLSVKKMVYSIKKSNEFKNPLSGEQQKATKKAVSDFETLEAKLDIWRTEFFKAVNEVRPHIGLKPGKVR